MAAGRWYLSLWFQQEINLVWRTVWNFQMEGMTVIEIRILYFSKFSTTVPEILWFVALKMLALHTIG